MQPPSWARTPGTSRLGQNVPALCPPHADPARGGARLTDAGIGACDINVAIGHHSGALCVWSERLEGERWAPPPKPPTTSQPPLGAFVQAYDGALERAGREAIYDPQAVDACLGAFEAGFSFDD